MHYCHMSEPYIMDELPMARGLQYIHAALLSQGVHCVRPHENEQKFNLLMSRHKSIVETYRKTEYQDGD